ncbi:uncharacterized protein MELLADRAFT_59955 [Melampsora larici-populina 98AG31]|uniref:Secreted protein n=1 Tax=Melampsora larici-populina (strain 98AG31 / pathotype 3-4-7) TaxID=747676 RepID=F4R9E8_MELLP|nr:uncharacterized protein MELLADRAFT_59955 [Melampsora larici-populina 98AG31]EGG11167.1 secreted protein [Melampsora larici-populina 98AG31]
MSATSRKAINNLLSSQFYLALAFLWLFSAQIVISSPIPHPNPALFGEAADIGHLAAQGGRSTSLGGLDAGKLAKNAEEGRISLASSRTSHVPQTNAGFNPFERFSTPEVETPVKGSKPSELKEVGLESGKTGLGVGSKVNKGIENIKYALKNVQIGLQNLFNRVSNFYTKLLIQRSHGLAKKEWNIGQQLSKYENFQKDFLSRQKLLELKNLHFTKSQEYDLKAEQLKQKLKPIV